MMSRYLTENFAGTGGSIREVPEDFSVEEIPLYEPCGEGEHLYLRVEKRGQTTFDLLHQLSRALGVRERDLGYAGLKDARATTCQTISVPGIPPDKVEGLELKGARILSAIRHRNKLRLGHLAGNRFVIRIRDILPNALQAAEDSLHVLRSTGVPNYFGEQRYGALSSTHLIGRALVKGDFQEACRTILGDPACIRNDRWRKAARLFRNGDLEGASAALPPRMRNERQILSTLAAGESFREAAYRLPRKLLRLYLSGYQSFLFDRLVAMRLDSLDLLWPGDLAYKHDNGACFVVEDTALEQPRADRFEISPSGALVGYKVPIARGQAGILEEGLLEKEGVRLEDFRLSGGLKMEGERRPLRVPLTNASVRQEGQDLFLSFDLPRGSYATSVLREIMKSAPQGPEPFATPEILP